MGTLHQTKEDILLEIKQIELAKRRAEDFGPLYEKYYKPIFLFILRRCDEENLTSDLTSQVFLKALVYLPKYQSRGLPFSAWLYRIASNEVNEYFRKYKGQRTISIEDQGLEDILREIYEPDGSEADRREGLVIQSFQKLKQDEVLLLELRFFEGKAFKDVAFILGITESNAKIKTYRVLDKIKQLIEKA